MWALLSGRKGVGVTFPAAADLVIISYGSSQTGESWTSDTRSLIISNMAPGFQEKEVEVAKAAPAACNLQNS
jgi:hypothetical protein